jgi:hypothetical protein
VLAGGLGYALAVAALAGLAARRSGERVRRNPVRAVALLLEPAR